MMNDKLQLQARLTQFDGCHERRHECHALASSGASELTSAFAEVTWEIAASLISAADRPDAVDGQVTFRVTAGAAREVAVAVEWPVTSWSRETFVMLPAAAYNGNRYPSRPYKYPPMVHEPGDVGLDAPILVTDVPRLSDEEGTPSRIQLLTGDLTTPAICFHNPRTGEAAILLTEQGSVFGNHGLTVEENADRSQAVLRIEAPGVRRDTLYTMVTTATPSWDRGADWVVGSKMTIRFRLFVFPARTVQDLYDRFAEVRRDLSGSAIVKCELPFSAAWRIVEEKYQRSNWCEDGYYRVSPHGEGGKFGNWQLGWVGGGMVPFPMLLAGQPDSRRRALRNLEWMFTQAQHPSGLFHAIQYEDVAFGDGFAVPGTERFYMVRKQADALYFLVKTFHLLQGQDAGWRLPESWSAGTRRLADRFVATFRKFGQLGQYLDSENGDVVVGGSTAAAMAPGALALAGQFYGQPDYLEVAEALARHLDERDVQAGITTGGPGEILKCADSESAFAMLESFIVLYEVTNQPHWLERAEAMAAQCMTWCATYDYLFPPESWFGRLDIRAAGSVWANVQNKHSAPGICTLSGDSLFKLFRYTGNRRYLEQIRETAHNLTQYICRTDRQIGDERWMKPGWMCERVNFSDWETRDNIGGSLFGSCWCEVSLMLTTVELPGIYWQPDTGLLCVFDHLEVRLVNEQNGAAFLECHNPTAFDAEVRLFIEPSAGANTILGQAAALNWPTIVLAAGETRRVCQTEATGVRGERIIDRTVAAWQSQQVQEPCILENPKDTTRLVMFYSGVPATNLSLAHVGKAWALKSDPFTWHQDPVNPVFVPAASGWDSRSIRLDCVLYVAEEDAYYIYYSGTDVADAHNRIGQAVCPAGADGYSGITAGAIRRHGAAPVLAPEPAEPFCETMASQAAVLRERDATGNWRWFMYYSYRGRNGTLPGIRLATSADGKVWQRHFNADDPRRMGHLFPSTPDAYYEWHQVFKVADTFVLSMEVGPNHGERWRTVLAVSRHPDRGWEQLDVDTVLQTRWPGIYSDDTIFHVATPAFYNIAGRWYLYTQACPLPANRNYIDGHWDLWAFACDRRISTRPGLADLFIPGLPVAPARGTLSNPLIAEDVPWAEFEAAFPPARPAQPILRHGAIPGMSNQVQHPCLIPDPQNPDRVYLYFTGCPNCYTGGKADLPGPNPRGENTISRLYADAHADLSLPESWTLDPRPICSGSIGSAWDDDRLGYLNAVLYNEADKTWYMYYWAGKTTSTRQIGVATSADGLQWHRHAGNPIIKPGVGEYDIEAGDVIKEGDQWFMLFCVGDTASRNGQSYKSAVSKDGLTWIRAGTVLKIGAPGTSDAGAFEFGHIFKVGTRYAFVYEAMNRYGGPGYRWTTNLAYTDSLTTEPWTRSALNPVFQGSGVAGSLDENHIGTPAVYTVNGQRYLFYQAIVTDGQNMDLAVAKFDMRPSR